VVQVRLDAVQKVPLVRIKLQKLSFLLNESSARLNQKLVPSPTPLPPAGNLNIFSPLCQAVEVNCTPVWPKNMIFAVYSENSAGIRFRQ
jgi:hypothetical protein